MPVGVDMNIKRGDVVLVNLDHVVGSEQGKIRPAVVLQNDIGNEFSPTTIVAPITSKVFSKEYPTNVEVLTDESGLEVNSTILLNQLRTIDKSRIIKKVSSLDASVMSRVNLAIKISLAVD